MAPPSSAPVAPPSGGRLLFVDHLRAALTVLVVAHHAAQAYGPTGGAWPVGEPVRSEALGLMITVNAMFFMGLFFFLSGCFTPATLARKGARAFVVDRLWRLGVPAAAAYLLTGLTMDRPQFLHLWFVVDLLGLNLLFAAAAVRWPALTQTPATPGRDPGVGAVVVLAGFLAGATALVRVEYPVDRWVDLLGVLPVEPAHAVQYATLFLLGLWAGRTRWLERMPEHWGRVALGVSVATVAAFAVYRFWPGRDFSWFAGGGASWRTLAFATLEAVLCVGLGLGLLGLFRARLGGESAAVRAFSADAYGIYVVHLPVVVVCQLLLRDVPLGPFAKFMLATVGAVLVSWAITRLLLRSTAWGRRIF